MNEINRIMTDGYLALGLNMSNNNLSVDDYEKILRALETAKRLHAYVEQYEMGIDLKDLPNV